MTDGPVQKPDAVPVPVFHVPPAPSVRRTHELRERLGVFSLRDLPPELKNSEADLNYTPWRVTLPFYSSRFMLTVDVKRVWFVRAPSPYTAIKYAHNAYKEFEEPWCPGRVFADYDSAVCIDEGDWADYWKEGKKWEDRCEIVVISRRDPAGVLANVRRAWHSGKPVLFRHGSPKHPTFWSVTGFNPDPDDERGPGSDILSMPWKKDSDNI